jgi:hypothetical protein
VNRAARFAVVLAVAAAGCGSSGDDTTFEGPSVEPPGPPEIEVDPAPAPDPSAPPAEVTPQGEVGGAHGAPPPPTYP